MRPVGMESPRLRNGVVHVELLTIQELRREIARLERKLLWRLGWQVVLSAALAIELAARLFGWW